MSRTLTIGPATIPVPALEWEERPAGFWPGKTVYESGDWVVLLAPSGEFPAELYRRAPTGNLCHLCGFQSLEIAQHAAEETEAREQLKLVDP